MRYLNAVLAALLVCPGTVSAQSSAIATVEITADVLSPITVTAHQALAFGKVGQGIAKTIVPDAPTSGRFEVVGNGAAGVSLTVTLPSVLSSGSNSLLIDNWTGRWSENSDNADGMLFTPESGEATAYTLPGDRGDPMKSLFFRLGAMVHPDITQPAGQYSGVIRVSVVYSEI